MTDPKCARPGCGHRLVSHSKLPFGYCVRCGCPGYIAPREEQDARSKELRAEGD